MTNAVGQGCRPPAEGQRLSVPRWLYLGSTVSTGAPSQTVVLIPYSLARQAHTVTSNTTHLPGTPQVYLQQRVLVDSDPHAQLFPSRLHWVVHRYLNLNMSKTEALVSLGTCSPPSVKCPIIEAMLQPEHWEEFLTSSLNIPSPVWILLPPKSLSNQSAPLYLHDSP